MGNIHVYWIITFQSMQLQGKSTGHIFINVFSKIFYTILAIDRFWKPDILI